MTKKELAAILKPLVKQCIKEVLFEETGILSHIIKETLIATTGIITETKSVGTATTGTTPTIRPKVKKQVDLESTRRKMLEAIGKDAYNGVNLFEGTAPLSSTPMSSIEPNPESMARNPLRDLDPNDPGVDISAFFEKK